MSINISASDLLACKSVFFGTLNAKTGEKTSDGIIDLKFRRSTAYKLSKIGDALEVELKRVETIHNKIVLDYGTKNKDGSVVVRKDTEEYKKFMEEYNELMGTTVILNGIDPLLLSELVDSKGAEVDIEPRQLMVLKWMVKEDERRDGDI